MRKNKLFAPFLTLVAVAISLFLMLKWGYKRIDMLWTLLVILIVFYVIGSLIQKRVNKFVEANEALLKEQEELEGAVIEKEATNEEDLDNSEAGEEASGGLPPLTGAMPERERADIS